MPVLDTHEHLPTFERDRDHVTDGIAALKSYDDLPEILRPTSIRKR